MSFSSSWWWSITVGAHAAAHDRMAKGGHISQPLLGLQKKKRVMIAATATAAWLGGWFPTRVSETSLPIYPYRRALKATKHRSGRYLGRPRGVGMYDTRSIRSRWNGRAWLVLQLLIVSHRSWNVNRPTKQKKTTVAGNHGGKNHEGKTNRPPIISKIGQQSSMKKKGSLKRAQQ